MLHVGLPLGVEQARISSAHLRRRAHVGIDREILVGDFDETRSILRFRRSAGGNPGNRLTIKDDFVDRHRITVRQQAPR